MPPPRVESPSEELPVATAEADARSSVLPGPLGTPRGAFTKAGVARRWTVADGLDWRAKAEAAVAMKRERVTESFILALLSVVCRSKRRWMEEEDDVVGTFSQERVLQAVRIVRCQTHGLQIA